MKLGSALLFLIATAPSIAASAFNDDEDLLFTPKALRATKASPDKGTRSRGLEPTLVEDVCESNDIPCIAPFENGGRRARAEPSEDKIGRHLQSSECSGLSAALVMMSCTYGLWGQTAYRKSQMDQVFGSHTCIEIPNGSTPSEAGLSSFDVIVVEGGDLHWIAVNNWLATTGKTTLENLAAAGKVVFVNAAPNYYGIGNLPFGATLETDLSGAYFVPSVNVVNTDLLTGTYQPTIATPTGRFYAHGVIRNYDGPYTPWIDGHLEEPVLVGGLPDAGPASHVLLGAMTTTNHHYPKPQVHNVYLNILDELCSLVDKDSDDDGVEDANDLCPGTEAGVLVDANGCSGEQLIDITCPCDKDPVWKNHGEYVNCVVNEAKTQEENGLLVEEGIGPVVFERAQLSCGKVDVCHVAGVDDTTCAAEAKTLFLSSKGRGIENHLKQHGDYLGSCADRCEDFCSDKSFEYLDGCMAYTPVVNGEECCCDVHTFYTCGENTDCVDNECVCEAGFFEDNEGDASNPNEGCDDINECDASPSPCIGGLSCHNTIGSFSCSLEVCILDVFEGGCAFTDNICNDGYLRNPSGSVTFTDVANDTPEQIELRIHAGTCYLGEWDVTLNGALIGSVSGYTPCRCYQPTPLLFTFIDGVNGVDLVTNWDQGGDNAISVVDTRSYPTIVSGYEAKIYFVGGDIA